MSDSLRANLWPKFEILTVLEAVFPHFCSDKRKVLHRGADHCPLRANLTFIRGEKPIFGSLSKNNTGMAALRADLPVKIQWHNHSIAR